MTPDWSESPSPVPYASLPYPQSLNLYSYVQNNPLKSSDPTGHCTVDGEQHSWWWCARHWAGWVETKKETAARIAQEKKDREWYINRFGHPPEVDAMFQLLGAAAMGMGAIGAVIEGGEGTPGEAAAARGAARASRVAALVGGQVVEGTPEADITVDNIGSSDFDVKGSAGEMIAVGGPAKAKDLADLGHRLGILRRVAAARGVRAMAYFEDGTPQAVLDVAKKQLGDNNVVVFPK